jgi:Flp pilus assembly protein TadD
LQARSFDESGVEMTLGPSFTSGGVRVGRADDGRAFEQATAALASPNPERALPALERALRTSRDYRLWHVHGLILRQIERLEEALVSLKRAVELNPQAPKTAYSLARTLYEAGLPSVAAYGQALRLAPGEPEIVKGLAQAFIADGEVDAAVSGLEQIVARSPLWIEGHVLLSKLRWMEGERDGFTRSFDDALAQYPQSLDLRREQIIALMHAEQWDEALSRIEQGRAAVGEHPLFGANEAIVYAEMGETKRADTLFAPYADYDDGPVQVRRVRHLLRCGRPEQAAELIESWLGRPEGFMFWPYASIAWRMVDKPRWEWLEGDDSFVGVYDIADRLPPLDQLADTLRGLHTLSGQPLEQSLRGGTQTDGDLFTHINPVLVQLREVIRATVAEHVAKFPAPDPRHPLLGPARDSIRFEGAWSVRLLSRGFHANHVHPHGWISSAFYVALPPDIGKDDAGVLTLGEARAPWFEIDLPPFRTIEPKPGRLVLFPSYMWHGTRPFGEGERLTVAFDVARMQSLA